MRTQKYNKGKQIRKDIKKIQDIDKKLKFTFFLINMIFFLLINSSSIQTLEINVTIKNVLEKNYNEKANIYIFNNETLQGNISINPSSNINLTTNFVRFDSNNFSLYSNNSNSITNNYTYIFNYSLSLNATGTGAYTLIFNINTSFSNGSANNFTLIKEGVIEDTIPPDILSSYVLPDSASTVNISVMTNENATCKYDIVNSTFDNLSDTFSSTGGILHTQPLFKQSGTYNYYIRCKDYNNNKMNYSYLLSYVIQDSAPKAKIMLSDPSPVKAGLLEITVTANENLAAIPQLQYSFDDSPSTRYSISLSGSGSRFNGYLFVPSSWNNRIGTFYFLGTDLSNINGSEITEGRIFILDTEKPPVPISLKISLENNTLKLSWYYEGEEVDYYNIYRSFIQPDYADLYSTSASTKFYDISFVYGKTYYYRVSAVDKAGNNGALSGQIIITPSADGNSQIIETIPEEKTKESLEAEKLAEIKLSQRENVLNKKLREIESLSVDVNYAISNLDSPDNELKDIISDFDLILDATKARQDIKELKEMIDELRKSELGDNEFEKSLNLLNLKIDSVKQNTPKNVYLIEKGEYIQAFDSKNITGYVQETLKNSAFSLTDTEINTYKDEVAGLQKQVLFTAKFKSATVEYLDRSRVNKTIITKEVSYQSPESLESVSFIEYIPKEIVSNVNNINIKTINYDVLTEDPVLKWDIKKLSYDKNQFIYIINKGIYQTELKKSKSIIIPNIEALRAKYKNSLSGALSGFSIFNLTSTGLDTSFIFTVIIGLLIIGVLSASYLVIKRKAQKESQLTSKLTALKLTEPKLEQIIKKIKEINDLLNQKTESKDIKEKIDNALKLYKEIEILYKELPKELKKRVYRECSSLRDSILALKDSVLEPKDKK